MKCPVLASLYFHLKSSLTCLFVLILGCVSLSIHQKSFLLVFSLGSRQASWILILARWNWKFLLITRQAQKFVGKLSIINCSFLFWDLFQILVDDSSIRFIHLLFASYSSSFKPAWSIVYFSCTYYLYLLEIVMSSSFADLTKDRHL